MQGGYQYIKELKNRYILNLGCGRDSFIQDPSSFYVHLDQQIDYVNERCDDACVVANGYRLPFLDNYFEVCFARRVAIGNDSFLSEISRILMPGGELVWSSEQFYANGIALNYKGIYPARSAYNSHHLKKIAKDTSFELSDVLSECTLLLSKSFYKE